MTNTQEVRTTRALKIKTPLITQKRLGRPRKPRNHGTMDRIFLWLGEQLAIETDIEQARWMDDGGRA